MENISKRRLLVGIVIALIIINLSALGTWGYQKYKRNHFNKDEKVQVKHPKQSREDRVKHFVKKELELNEKQCDTYYKSMDRNFSETKIWLGKIAKCKRDIINQTLAENADTAKLNVLCDSLGYFHNRMQREINRHFLEVKLSLDSNQKAKLKEILIRMNEKDLNNEDRKYREKNKNN